jgi:hypothetical protein
MNEDDKEEARLALKAYIGEHPGCAPEEAVTELGLPDMTSIPQDRRARTAEHRHRAREADLMLHYAKFFVSMRDTVRASGGDR